MDDAEYERRVFEPLGPMSPSKLPPVPKEKFDVLEPLTPRELLGCIREANMDRQDHIRKSHPHEEVGNFTVLYRVLEKLVDPEYAAAVARSTGLAGDPTDEGTTEGDALAVWRWGASNAVSQYWAHATEGHPPPAKSEGRRRPKRKPRNPEATGLPDRTVTLEGGLVQSPRNYDSESVCH